MRELGVPPWLVRWAIIALCIGAIGSLGIALILIALRVRFISIAVLIGFAEVSLLWPLVKWLRAQRVPQVIAAILCVVGFLSFFALLLLFGAIGATVWAVQMAWIPVTAAGIINGIGHYWGYRNFACADASTNIVPWGIIIGGEELHNNHHAYGTSAKLSSQWYEFDIGWVYIRLLAAVRLAKVIYARDVSAREFAEKYYQRAAGAVENASAAAMPQLMVWLVKKAMK